MPSIHDSAVRNFEAAAALLMALQKQRINLVSEVMSGLVGKPKVLLTAGYTALTPMFGICVPGDARAEVSKAVEKDGLDLQNSGLNWITFESRLAKLVNEMTCYLDMRADFPAPVVADVFLREFKDDGGMVDTLHQEWNLGADRASLCKIGLPKVPSGVTERRIIVQLRQPPRRFSIESLALTFI
jgi:hypothetical protein